MAPPPFQGSTEEVPLASHRTRLKNVHKNLGFDVDGVYLVEQSRNSFASNALTWRVVLVDVDREAVSHTLAQGGDFSSRSLLTSFPPARRRRRTSFPP